MECQIPSLSNIDFIEFMADYISANMSIDTVIDFDKGGEIIVIESKTFVNGETRNYNVIEMQVTYYSDKDNTVTNFKKAQSLYNLLDKNYYQVLTINRDNKQIECGVILNMITPLIYEIDSLKRFLSPFILSVWKRV